MAAPASAGVAMTRRIDHQQRCDPRRRVPRAGGRGTEGSANGVAGLAGAGILVSGSGVIVNQAGGVISGYDGTADKGSGHVTLTNYGSIMGAHDAVLFRAASDRLIAEAGSSFVGEVVGGGGVLELAGGAGTITGLGSAGTLTGAIGAGFQGFPAPMFWTRAVRGRLRGRSRWRPARA